jgi:urease subunit beta
MIPGEYIIQNSDVELSKGRNAVRVKVINTGDRPVQVGSHFHFFEVNRQMAFDREKAYGMRLNIIAGTAVRFEPGEEKEVELVAYAGRQIVYGHNNLVNGNCNDEATKNAAMEKLVKEKFKNSKS